MYKQVLYTPARTHTDMHAHIHRWTRAHVIRLLAPTAKWTSSHWLPTTLILCCLNPFFAFESLSCLILHSLIGLLLQAQILRSHSVSLMGHRLPAPRITWQPIPQFLFLWARISSGRLWSLIQDARSPSLNHFFPSSFCYSLDGRELPFVITRKYPRFGPWTILCCTNDGIPLFKWRRSLTVRYLGVPSVLRPVVIPHLVSFSGLL